MSFYNIMDAGILIPVFDGFQSEGTIRHADIQLIVKKKKILILLRLIFK